MSDIGGIGYSGADFEPVLGEQDAGESHVQEQPAPSETGATQSSMPFRLQNLSKIGLIPPDSNSPVTPDNELLARYADPNALPGPTGSSEHSVSFGSVEIPADKAHYYEKVRKHMAEGGPRAQKYLATLENREIKTTVYPYKGNAPIQPLHGGDLLKAETQTKPDTESITVKFATDQAILGPSGAVISPATAAAHELAHAARITNDPSHTAFKMVREWGNTEELHVTTKVEHDVAKAHDEGLRDSHFATAFKTENIKSTVPANPLTRRNVELARPGLERWTRDMDKHGVGAIHEDHPAVAGRIAKIRMVDFSIIQSESAPAVYPPGQVHSLASGEQRNSEPGSKPKPE